MKMHQACTGTLSAIAAPTGLTGCRSQDFQIASVGIIGGADGPTKVVVSSAVNWPLAICVFLVVAATGLILYLCFKRKK